MTAHQDASDHNEKLCDPRLVGGGRVFSYVDNRQNCNQVTHEIVAGGIVEADAVYDEDTATKVVKMPGIGCRVLHGFTFDPMQQTRRRAGGVEFCDAEMEPRSSPNCVKSVYARNH